MVALRNRRLDIERAKGLAILFVVFGHIVARADPAGVAWYEPVRRAIYSFHMPFFLYLSGMVAVLSGALFLPPGQWGYLARARARRLLIPFFAMGSLIVFGKLIAAQFMFVDNRPANPAAGLADLFWHTGDSAAISVWYLFVLFALTVTAPFLIRADQGRLRLFLFVAACLYFVPMPQYFYLDHIGRYAVFFAAGALAGVRDEGWTRFVDRHWRGCLLLLLCLLIAVACFGAHWPEKAVLLPAGLLSMPALHGLVRHLRLPFARASLWLGQYSFMIYLFNTICIGLAKGLLLRVASWDGANFIPFAAVLMLAGSLGPVLLKQALLQRIEVLRRRIV